MSINGRQGWQLSEVVWSNQDLTPTDKLVLLALVNHLNDETGACYPSWDRLATRTGLSRRTISRTIARLEDEGFIDATRKPGTSTRYELFKSLGVTMTPPPCHHDTPYGSGLGTADQPSWEDVSLANYGLKAMDSFVRWLKSEQGKDHGGAA